VIDLDDFKKKAGDIARARADATQLYKDEALNEAACENKYRKHKAQAFARARINGSSIAECEMIADSETAGEREARDIARVGAKTALLRIQELEADRAMLRVEADWSQRMEGLPQPAWSSGG
jgi:hypothetical protein